ncbi:helix-turn-helix transcriptional regulator [Nonomuraea muscovyensis]
MSLSSLGLTALDETVYRALLRGDGAPPGDPGATRASMARLTQLELVRLDADGKAVAIEPGLAISRLIRRRLLETSAEQRRISAAWETLHMLTAEDQSTGSALGVERIDGVEQVNERLWSMAADAYEVMTIQSVRRRAVPEMLPTYLKRLTEGVRWRTIVPRGSLRRQDVIEYVLALHRAGDHHRVIEEPAQQMVIFDRAMAFVPTVPNASGSGALMFRQAGAVATMVDLFERVWAHATDLEPDQAPALTPRERQVLHLLSSAGKDEVAAREMGVSLRTYRRHVAELLDRLGAANRFQAALFAQRQGWI